MELFLLSTKSHVKPLHVDCPYILTDTSVILIAKSWVWLPVPVCKHTVCRCATTVHVMIFRACRSHQRNILTSVRMTS